MALLLSEGQSTARTEIHSWTPTLGVKPIPDSGIHFYFSLYYASLHFSMVLLGFARYMINYIFKTRFDEF